MKKEIAFDFKLPMKTVKNLYEVTKCMHGNDDKDMLLSFNYNKETEILSVSYKKNQKDIVKNSVIDYTVDGKEYAVPSHVPDFVYRGFAIFLNDILKAMLNDYFKGDCIRAFDDTGVALIAPWEPQKAAPEDD